MADDQSKSRALPVPAKRVSRIGRITGMTAGVAGNMALNGLAQLSQGKRPKMRDLLLTPSNVSRIADQLAKMRGAAMKIGQLVSMDTGDVLPPELSQIMARLRDDAHFMPASQLKKVLNTQLPENWLRSFKKFDVHPIAAASIGQVHRATLRDGRELAIKVQYPGVAQSIDSDVANVGALIRMSGLLPKGIELAPYLEEARLQLHEETNYVHEGKNLKAFGELLRDDARFTVPELVSEWSTPEILAMTYVPGRPIEQAAETGAEERNRIAYNLIDLTLSELFHFGVMQTDPNFANYRYYPETGRIILLDFGATRYLDPVITKQYRTLMQAGLERDVNGLQTIAGEIGFFGPETKSTHRDQITGMIQMVFDSVLDDPLYDFSDMSLSQDLQQAGMALAEDGFTPLLLPIDVLLIQRKFGGMFLLANRLGAQVDVGDLLRKNLLKGYPAGASAAE